MYTRKLGVLGWRITVEYLRDKSVNIFGEMKPQLCIEAQSFVGQHGAPCIEWQHILQHRSIPLGLRKGSENFARFRLKVWNPVAPSLNLLIRCIANKSLLPLTMFAKNAQHLITKQEHTLIAKFLSGCP